MKIAYVHVLPLEYYPPATNFLDLLASKPDTEIRVYSTDNLKGRDVYRNTAVDVRRLRWADPETRRARRMAGVLGWHWRVARELEGFAPDRIVSVEPHSAIAVWLYYRVFGGSARLYIHHHEYYEPTDYQRSGMTIPRLASRLEQSGLFPRAAWISQTNHERLDLARRSHAGVAAGTWTVLPNYPPADWASMAHRTPGGAQRPLRLVYVGSASFEDTYIGELVEWASRSPGDVRLHVCGYNVSDPVRDWLVTREYSNVTFDPGGCGYHELPALLAEFDVGLVLYKGNTRNFVHNVPNKVFEYLHCGLEVWYPREMTGMRNFARNQALPIRELDFGRLDEWPITGLTPRNLPSDRVTEFTAERAFGPLLTSMGLNSEAGRA